MRNAGVLIAVLIGCGRVAEAMGDETACHLPALTDAQVHDIARKSLGDAFMHPQGLPPRPWKVSSRNCDYYFEYVVLSHENTWFGFDAIDGVDILVVHRDGSSHR